MQASTSAEQLQCPASSPAPANAAPPLASSGGLPFAGLTHPFHWTHPGQGNVYAPCQGGQGASDTAKISSVAGGLGSWADFHFVMIICDRAERPSTMNAACVHPDTDNMWARQPLKQRESRAPTTSTDTDMHIQLGEPFKDWQCCADRPHSRRDRIACLGGVCSCNVPLHHR